MKIKHLRCLGGIGPTKRPLKRSDRSCADAGRGQRPERRLEWRRRAMSGGGRCAVQRSRGSMVARRRRCRGLFARAGCDRSASVRACRCLIDRRIARFGSEGPGERGCIAHLAGPNGLASPRRGGGDGPGTGVVCGGTGWFGGRRGGRRGRGGAADHSVGWIGARGGVCFGVRMPEGCLFERGRGRLVVVCGVEDGADGREGRRGAGR